MRSRPLRRHRLRPVADLDLSDVAVQIFRDDEQVDQAHDVVLAQPVKLIQHGAIEDGVLAVAHDEKLYRTKCHCSS